MLLTSPSETTSELGDDLVVPDTVTITDLRAFDGAGYVEIEATFDGDQERYLATRVVVGGSSDGFEASSAVLRSVRVQELMQEGLANAVDFELGSGEHWPFPLHSDLAGYVNTSGPSSIAAMEWVSRIYRLARALNMRPAKAVQEQLGLSVPTASVWIRRARDRGFLASPTRGEELADG